MRYNLSEITDVIQDRRTIYPEFFSDRKVHKEHIERILNNGIWAPTHGNTQPWQFKVFMGSGRHKLSDFLSSTYKSMTPKSMHKMYKLLKQTMEESVELQEQVLTFSEFKSK